jgi:hypothetical protein
MGSGTTALAAMRLGRRCIGFDISDHYVQLAEQRIAEQREQQQQAALEAAAQAAQLQLENDAPDSKIAAPTTPAEDRPQAEAKAPPLAVAPVGIQHQERELARASPVP